MKTFKELYHARIAWNQQSNIPSVEEAQIVELSKKDSFKQYLSYHEGWGNYKNYKKKQKVILLAKKVQNQSYKYKNQVEKCSHSLQIATWNI